MRMDLRELYGEGIREFGKLLSAAGADPAAKNVAQDCFAWPSVKNQVLLKAEAAVELGGGNLPAVSGVLYAELPEFEEAVRQVLLGGDASAPSGGLAALCGRDLSGLRGDVPYARVTLIGVREEFLREEYKLYQLLRSIEYIRYHVEPKGYMPRISTLRGREQVRVSEAAVRDGLDFYRAGRSFADAYLAHPAVGAAAVFFVTEEQFDYGALQALFDRAETALMSLDHPLNHLKMDCSVCHLKPVCDEAENLCAGD